MRFFRRNRKPTKQSCLLNAVVALLIGAFMVYCKFDSSVTPEQSKNFLIGAGIMVVVTIYWIWRYIKFEDKDFNDPFHMEH